MEKSRNLLGHSRRAELSNSSMRESQSWPSSLLFHIKAVHDITFLYCRSDIFSLYKSKEILALPSWRSSKRSENRLSSGSTGRRQSCHGLDICRREREQTVRKTAGMGLGVMPRRQYEATWLGLPMKQVSLVTVGKQQPFGQSRNILTALKLTVQNSALILVCHSESTCSKTCPDSLPLASTLLTHHATDSRPKISYIHSSVHE